MSKTKSFLVFAVAGAALALASNSASAGTASCSGPAVGADTLGPQLCIVLNPDGTASVINGPGSAQGPYDSNDDAYIGVINNSSIVVSAITLSSNTDIMGFDGDGIGVGPYSGTGIQQYGTLNPSDTTGYGGPNSFFTVTDADDGVVHFITPLAANGGTTYFSLEDQLTSASFSVTQVSSTPLPAALPLFATGLGGLGFFGWRRKKKTVATA